MCPGYQTAVSHAYFWRNLTTQLHSCMLENQSRMLLLDTLCMRADAMVSILANLTAHLSHKCTAPFSQKIEAPPRSAHENIPERVGFKQAELQVLMSREIVVHHGVVCCSAKPRVAAPRFR